MIENSSNKLFFLSIISFVFFVVGVSPAHAWGQLPELRTDEGRGHIVFAALERGRIGYCLETGDASFPPADIELQVEAALKVWLVEVGDFLQAPVLIEKDCNRESLDLSVFVGPAEPGATNLGRHSLIEMDGRPVSRVSVNTAPSHGVRVERTNLFDFDPGLVTAVEKAAFLDHIRDEGLSLNEVASELGLATTLPLTASIYQTLIHEFGHSFGLCDAKEATYEQRCDRAFRSRLVPTSLMSISGALNLMFDDRDGIRAIFERFAE